MKLFSVNTKILEIECNSDRFFAVESSFRKYNVTITAENPLQKLATLYKSSDVVIIDERLIELYGINSDFYTLYSIPAAEENKTIETCLDLVSFLSARNFNKGNTLFVVGGGIIQDIGSFAAAVYKRGVNWVLFPTTLLSMCDSCIGGKNGINYRGVKNQLALFSSPQEVFICTQFIKTLESNDIKSGLGEVLKLFSIGGKSLMEEYYRCVENGQVVHEDSYADLILLSLKVKKAIIEEDEFEYDIRKSLNYGHTIGHILETLSNYKISHGEAVALGMIIINRLYNKNLARLDNACLELIDLSKLGHLDYSNLGDLLMKDKKTMGDVATLVVLEQEGEIKFYEETIKQSLIDDIIGEINKIA